MQRRWSRERPWRCRTIAVRPFDLRRWRGDPANGAPPPYTEAELAVIIKLWPPDRVPSILTAQRAYASALPLLPPFADLVAFPEVLGVDEGLQAIGPAVEAGGVAAIAEVAGPNEGLEMVFGLAEQGARYPELPPVFGQAADLHRGEPRDEEGPAQPLGQQHEDDIPNGG